MNSKALLDFINNKNKSLNFIQKIKRRTLLNKFDYSKILFDDIMYSGS